jgi:hypothetical protein
MSRRVKLSFEGGEAVVRLNDTPTSRDLLSLLPLTLTWKDHAGTEKVATPPRKLSTAGAPAGSDPSVGDFAYYAPWGNLALYYRDFGHSSGLVLLGTVESGLETLAAREGDFTVRIEALE